MTITEERVGTGGGPTTDERTDIIEFNDLVTDFVIPCDGFNPDVMCKNAAEFAAHMTCCGQRYLFCPDCLLDTIGYVKSVMENKKHLRCRKCSKVNLVENGDFFVVDGRI